MTLKKILLPTDFSAGSDRAYPVAQKLALAFGSKIDLLHVIPTGKYLSESLRKLSIPLSIEKDIYPKIISESEEKLSQVMMTSIPESSRGEFFVKIDRKPSETIADHARDNRYDLIIMGSRGGDESSAFRGGTTERVIRKSDVAVLSVDSMFNGEMTHNILVPTDSSSLSFSAFPMAALLAGTFDSRLTLFHVLELYGTFSEAIPRDPEKGEEISIYEVLIKRLGDYLKKYGNGLFEIARRDEPFEDDVIVNTEGTKRKIPVHTKIGHGISAHYEIERVADEEADMVVMATHGYSGLSHLLLGSTAEKVAQHLNKPVLTVRPDKSMFKS